ncbi:hypothetical protein SRS16P2_00496 (plasmid) [Variovorax sp. SRS16]|nr:hypothetical protein SRS16P2_00496 [Variovorax sp. SRS16]
MKDHPIPVGMIPGDRANDDAALREKLTDALTPGFVAEFDPDEAERAGAFEEDALSEADAADSSEDLPAALDSASVTKEA